MKSLFNNISDNKRFYQNLTIQERVKIYNYVMNFHKKFSKLGGTRISRMILAKKGIKIPHKTITRWIREGRNPKRTYNWFEEKPKRDLAYIIGAVEYGDGYPGGDRVIGLEVKDEEFAKEVAMRSARIFRRKQPFKVDRRRTRKGYYRVRINSKLLLQFFKKGLTKNKKKIIETFPAEFIKGVADADGCPVIAISNHRFRVYVEIAKDWELKRIRTIFNILKNHFRMKPEIVLTGKPGEIHIIQGRLVIAKKKVYITRLRRLDDIKKFTNYIGFGMKRKQVKLLDAIKIKEKAKSEDKAIKEWEKLYSKINGKWVKINASQATGSTT